MDASSYPQYAYRRSDDRSVRGVLTERLPISVTSGPSPGKRPLGVLFSFRSIERWTPSQSPETLRGTIHIDGYAGLNELFADGGIVEAACWAPLRRKFFDVHAATGSSIAKEALDCYRRTLAGRRNDPLRLPQRTTSGSRNPILSPRR